MYKIFILFILGLLAPILHAQEKVGERYAGIEATALKYGDDLLDEVYDSVYILGAVGNFPINPNLDLYSSLRFTSLDGELVEGGDRIKYDGDAWGLETELLYHFKPDQALNPFLSGKLAFIDGKAGASNGFDKITESVSTWGYGVRAGLSYAANETFSLIPSIGYLEGEDDGQFILRLQSTFDLSEQVFIAPFVQYAEKTENSRLGLTLNHSF